jgi:uncharacterized protein (TIGR02246 family)
MMYTTTETDVAAVQAVLARIAEAWAAHDGAAYGAEFTEDASYVTFVGTHYRGAKEIGDVHAALWQKFLKGTKLAYELTDLRIHGDTAIVVTAGDTYKNTLPARLKKVQTYTLVRGADGAWRVAAFHNTKRAALMEKISFKFEPRTIPAGP